MSGSSPPPFWDIAWRNAQPHLQNIQSSLESLPIVAPRIARVGQLDSELLDQELLNVLKEPVIKALGLIHSAYETRFEPELSVVIATILYKLSMWDQGATYGAKLQDLKYRASRVSNGGWKLAPSGLPRRTLCTHAFLTIVLPYMHTRFRTHALSRAWPDTPSSDPRRKAWEILTRLEAIYAAAGLSGFIAFLWGGRYRTISDRVVGLRLVPARPIVTRDVSYEFMNRQMVWHSFTEFLIFLLPLINMRVIRRRASRIYEKTSLLSLVPQPVRKLLRISEPSEEETLSKPSSRRGKYWSLPPDECGICAEDASFAITDTTRSVPHESESAYPITTPYITNCSHTYCYLCLSERMIRGVDDGVNWECVRCEESVRSCERVEGEYVEINQGDASSDGFESDGSSSAVS